MKALSIRFNDGALTSEGKKFTFCQTDYRWICLPNAHKNAFNNYISIAIFLETDTYNHCRTYHPQPLVVFKIFRFSEARHLINTYGYISGNGRIIRLKVCDSFFFLISKILWKSFVFNRSERKQEIVLCVRQVESLNKQQRMIDDWVSVIHPALKYNEMNWFVWFRVPITVIEKTEFEIIPSLCFSPPVFPLLGWTTTITFLIIDESNKKKFVLKKYPFPVDKVWE